MDIQYQVFDVKALKKFELKRSNEILRVTKTNQANKEWRDKCNPTQDRLNFEIIGHGVIIPLNKKMSIPCRIRENLKKRNVMNPNLHKESPDRRIVALFEFSGSKETMRKMAYGTQPIKWGYDEDNSFVKREGLIEMWAVDIYRFMVNKYGEDNIVAFVVHCDEHTPDAHCVVLPVSSIGKFSWNWVFSGRNKREYRDYMYQLNDEIAEVNRQYGLERGKRKPLRGGRRVITEHDKEVAVKEVDQLNERKKTLSDEYNGLLYRYHQTERKIKSLNTMIGNLEKRIGDYDEDLQIKINEKKQSLEKAEEELKKEKELLSEKEESLRTINNTIKDYDWILNGECLSPDDKTLRDMKAFIFSERIKDARARAEARRRFLAFLPDDKRKLCKRTFQLLLDDSIDFLDENIISIASLLFSGYNEYAVQYAKDHGKTLRIPENWQCGIDESNESWRERCFMLAMDAVTRSGKR